MRYLVIVFLIVFSLGLKAQIVMDSVMVTHRSFYDTARSYPMPKLSDLDDSLNPIVLEANRVIFDELVIDWSDEYQKWVSGFGVLYESSYQIKSDLFWYNYSGSFTAAYSTEFHDQEFFIDLKTGKKLINQDIPFHKLFTPTGYFDFLHKYWLEDIKLAFEESWNRLTEDQSPKGEIDLDIFWCSYYDVANDYELVNDTLKLSMQWPCLPHVSQALSPDLWLDITLSELEPFIHPFVYQSLTKDQYLEKKGIEKYLYNQQINDDLPQYDYLFGKIDGKYPFDMAISISDEGEVSGFYQYENKRQNIDLMGSVFEDGITLTEKVNGKITGSFKISFSDHRGKKAGAIYIEDRPYYDGKLIYVSCTWTNPKGQEFAVELTELKGTLGY